jgi:hypothetical protein
MKVNKLALLLSLRSFASQIRYRSVRFTHTKRYRISEHSELSVSEFLQRKNEQSETQRSVVYGDL